MEIHMTNSVEQEPLIISPPPHNFPGMKTSHRTQTNETDRGG